MHWLKKHRWEMLSFLISSVLVFFIAKRLVEYQQYSKKKLENVTINAAPITYDNEDLCWGTKEASVTIYLYYSYTCSPCITFFTHTYPKLEKNYIKRNKVRLVLKPVNLSNSEELNNAIECVYCLNRVGQMESIHQLLVENNDIIYSPELKLFVEKLINVNSELQDCLSNHTYKNQILANNSDLNRLEISATPTFVIGNKIYKGGIEYHLLSKIIKKELKKTQQ